jgi:phosphoglycerate dehydrogenase-like enzyme
MLNVVLYYTIGFTLTEQHLAMLRHDFPQCKFTETNKDSVTETQLETADILAGSVPPDLVRKAKNLKWLHLPSVGVDRHIDTGIYVNADAKLTNSSGAYGKPISDLVIGYMIALSRDFPYYQRNQEQGIWKRKAPTKELFDSTICIVGLGDIGMELARKAKVFEMHVVAIKRTLVEKPEFVDELYTLETFDEVLKKSDFVVLCLAATDETVNLMNAARLTMMKKDAYLINVGRGSLVDQTALYECLANRTIAGAAVDVTVPEPLPSDHPLWKLDNIMITPHYAGSSPSTQDRLYTIFHSELERYLSGQPLKNLIDFSVKY